MKAIKVSACLSALAIAYYCGHSVGFSQDSAPPASTETPAATPAATDAAAPASGAALQGSVEKVELSLEKLRDIGLDLKQVLKAADSLYDEVTIQPVRIITQPEVIGNGMIINIPIGKEPIGPPQPPRKERVDLAMKGIEPTVQMMKRNVDNFVSGKLELDLPAPVMTELDPQFKGWVAAVNDMAAKEAKLEQLTVGPTYDNAAIADQAAQIQRDVKYLDERRRAIYKVIRNEGKRRAKSKTTA
jgi:hypothetical protein